MEQTVSFLFNEQLVAALIQLIRDAKSKLLLISPAIELDNRLVDALRQKKESHDFELQVLFGKVENEGNKGMKQEIIEFLKQFPNVEIRYNERLQATFYLNEYEYISGSMNLYNFSKEKNIEVGVRCEYASRGFLGKALDVTAVAIEKGVDKVKQEVIGSEKGISPIERFAQIFSSAELLYKTQPTLANKGGLMGNIMGSKKLTGFQVVTDNFPTEAPAPGPVVEEPALINTLIPEPAPVVPPVVEQPNALNDNCVSAAHLSKTFGVQIRDIIFLMERKGYIQGDHITQLGYQKGLVLKNYMGTTYIAYPENMQELNEFRM